MKVLKPLRRHRWKIWYCEEKVDSGTTFSMGGSGRKRYRNAFLEIRILEGKPDRGDFISRVEVADAQSWRRFHGLLPNCGEGERTIEGPARLKKESVPGHRQGRDADQGRTAEKRTPVRPKQRLLQAESSAVFCKRNYQQSR